MPDLDAAIITSVGVSFAITAAVSSWLWMKIRRLTRVVEEVGGANRGKNGDILFDRSGSRKIVVQPGNIDII